MPAAEDVERQVAVAIIVTMEEAPLLVPVHRIVSGVEIEHDFTRRRLVRLDEQVDEQALDGCGVMADPMVARGGARRGMLQPVERRLAGQRRTVAPLRRQPVPQ